MNFSNGNTIKSVLQVNYNLFPQPSSTDLLDSLIAIHFTAHRQAVYVLLPGTSLRFALPFRRLQFTSARLTRRTTTNFNFSSVHRSDLPRTINSSIGQTTTQLDGRRPRSKSNRRRRATTTTYQSTCPIPLLPTRPFCKRRILIHLWADNLIEVKQTIEGAQTNL